MTMMDFARKCVSSPLNTAITLVICLLGAWVLPGLIEWLLVNAVWRGRSAQDCANVDAACWLFIRVRWQQILYGWYPTAEQWRPIVCLGAMLLWAIFVASQHRRSRILLNIGTALMLAVAAGLLLRGGVLGLAPVPTKQWGGILLTVVVAACTIAAALPLGLVLALGRRSRLPVVSMLSATYIEVMRGLPLVGVLFIAIILFPLFVPPDVEINALVRTLIAFSLFNAANMAEAIRGGLQSVPKGQYEAALSLGLGHWQAMAFSVIPQAVRVALPAIINISISIIKETTIILMAGMLDFIGILQGSLLDPEWLVGDQIRVTAYIFAGVVFFVVCFALSKYSLRIERRMSGASRE